MAGGEAPALSIRVWLLLVPVLILLFAPTNTSKARSQMDEGDERPLVERVTFQGISALRDRELRPGIRTQGRHCRSLFVQPLCWVADWSLVEEHYYLDEHELNRDVVRLRVLYFRRGYRQASVAAEVIPLGDGVEVAFHIEEGEPTVVDSLEIRHTPQVLTNRQLRRARLPGEGDVLNLVSLQIGMSYLRERLGSAGYLDSTVRDTIRVDETGRRARLTVHIESGRRSTLRELDISGNSEVDNATIDEGLRLKRGKVLRVNDIVAARRSLYESNLFHEVDVSVPPQPDSAKRVDVRVREAPPRVVRVGGGFNTIDFVQFEARYTHYNWMGDGRRFDVRGIVGNLLAGQLNDRLIFQNVLPTFGLVDSDPFVRPTWEVSIGFLQPAFQSAENVLGLDLFANRRTIPGIAIDQGYGGEVTVTRRIDYNTPLSLSYAYELTSVDAGDLYFCVNYGVCDSGTIKALRSSNAMSPVAVSLIADRADSPLAPTSGYRLRAGIEHASRFTQSQFRYNRFTAEGIYYWPADLYRRRVVASRIRVGWVRHLAGSSAAIGVGLDDASDDLLHPRKRFYAGGSRSVRGYGENQLGPKILTIDPNVLLESENGCTREEISAGTCDPAVAPIREFVPRPLGGTSVLEASVEYRFPFGNMTGAIFLDGAAIGEGIAGAFDTGNWVVTPGFGIRLASPVGPIRLDLGVRPGISERLPVITESLDDSGQRRLVELDTPRDYDPVKAAGGGFLGAVFSRLALHLSIGEAY